MTQIQSTLSSKNQIVIPSEIRKALGVASGDHIMWSIAHVLDKPKVIAERVPENWADTMKGLGKDLWKSVSLEKYIHSLRQEWQQA